MDAKIFHVRLNDVSLLKRFVQVAGNIPCKVTAVQSGWNVDAKSILAMLSLDLSKDVAIKIEDDVDVSFMSEFCV